MLFDLFTGILSALFIVLCLIYPLRRKIKLLGKVSRLKFHCICGYLLLLTAFIHSNSKLFTPNFSFGFAVLLALILVVITGILKRYFSRIKLFHTIHVLAAVIFMFIFIIHVGQQVIYLFIM
jgi:hypothetical protein